MKKIKVSAIIPIVRKKLAQKAIESVKSQNYPNLEIVRVNAERLNPAQARNKGAKRAIGKILLFLDDDCETRDGWLKENLKALDAPKIGAVGGRIEGRSKKYFAKCLDFSNFTFVQNNTRRAMPLCTASLGILKKNFEKIGGFDEKIIIGEDVDLCFRLNKIGLETVYEPKIKVWHQHGRESIFQVLKYQFNNGRVKGLIMETRYPDSLWFMFLKAIASPWIYWIFVLPFSLMAAIIAVGVNLKDSKRVIYLFPGIFLAKLACQAGIFVWCIRKAEQE